MKFFFALGKEGEENFYMKQMFRLEWENWWDAREYQDKPNKAAYPHWQFDRWLTASEADDQTLEALRQTFVARENQREREGILFESAKLTIRGPITRERPDLAWFTRLHFPSIAPWATDPIKDLDAQHQPHRCIPESVTELADWIESSLRYIKNEVATYAGKRP